MQSRMGVALVAVALVGSAGLAACNDASGSEGPQPVALTFVSAPASAAISAGDPITVNGHTLDVTSVDVTFSEVVLEREEGFAGGGDSEGGVDDADSDSEADSDSDGAANEHFRSGPVTVSLPLQGGVITPITTPIPVGTYEELELDIATVRLRGTYDGQAFDVVVPVDEELEAELEPLFVVDDDSDRLNLTIVLDVTQWFRTSGGVLIDPRLLATSASLRSEFIDRIERDFKAFEDSDRDADDADSDSDSEGD